MSRRTEIGLWMLLAIAVWVPSAEAQPLGPGCSPRVLCITDPQGVTFHSWYGSPVAFNSYAYWPAAGGYSPGFNGTTNGYFGGGIPAVASATTPEWTVQRTSVFPVGSYAVWNASPNALVSPWAPRLGSSEPAPRRDTALRLVSGDDVDQQQPFAEGDRLMREGQPARAYQRYLQVQSQTGDAGDVYFRQAFALVAMSRYEHAISKFQRGLQVDAEDSPTSLTLDEVFGESNREQTAEHLRRVAQWADSAPQSPSRRFLEACLRHFDDDPLTIDLLNAAEPQTGRSLAWKSLRLAHHRRSANATSLTEATTASE